MKGEGGREGGRKEEGREEGKEKGEERRTQEGTWIVPSLATNSRTPTCVEAAGLLGLRSWKVHGDSRSRLARRMTAISLGLDMSMRASTH